MAQASNAMRGRGDGCDKTVQECFDNIDLGSSLETKGTWGLDGDVRDQREGKRMSVGKV